MGTQLQINVRSIFSTGVFGPQLLNFTLQERKRHNTSQTTVEPNITCLVSTARPSHGCRKTSGPRTNQFRSDRTTYKYLVELLCPSKPVIPVEELHEPWHPSEPLCKTLHYDHSPFFFFFFNSENVMKGVYRDEPQEDRDGVKAALTLTSKSCVYLCLLEIRS